jgi:hypothetical protein
LLVSVAGFIGCGGFDLYKITDDAFLLNVVCLHFAFYLLLIIITAIIITSMMKFRYTVGDPVESWLNSLLCLDATVAPRISSGNWVVVSFSSSTCLLLSSWGIQTCALFVVLPSMFLCLFGFIKSLFESSQVLLFLLIVLFFHPFLPGCPHPDQCELYCVNRDTLFSFNKVAEVFLQRIMALYVASHYKVRVAVLLTRELRFRSGYIFHKALRQSLACVVPFPFVLFRVSMRKLTRTLFSLRSFSARLGAPQKTPNNHQQRSDAPAHRIFCLLGPVDPAQGGLPEILCVIQVGRASMSGRGVYFIVV